MLNYKIGSKRCIREEKVRPTRDKHKVKSLSLFTLKEGGAWLAQSEENVTLDLRVMSPSPMLGIEMTK